jgi:hypothetical protein
MSLCDKCFYHSRTRYGFLCSFDGAYNPHKTECSNYKSLAEAEAEKAGTVEATKLVASILDRLAELQPQIEKLGDGELKNSLTELCLAAKQVKRLIGGW